MDSFLTHTGVEVYKFRKFETTCFVHILDLDHVGVKLINGFSSVDERAREKNAQLAFNANGWGLQPGNVSASNEYLMIEGQVIQATALDNRPCMNITKDGQLEFLDRPNFTKSYNVIGFDRYIARHGLFNTAIHDISTAPRTVYGKDTSGCLVILVCEGRRAGEKGLTFAECWNVMQDFNVTDCGNADGGYSSACINSFFGGLMNESYKVEYRRTVMQVLFFATQLGEVMPPTDPPTEGTPMPTYKVLAPVAPRQTPSMYSASLPNIQTGFEFVSGAEKNSGNTGDANNGVVFQQLPNGYWVPMVYKGTTYLQAVTVVTPPVSTPYPDKLIVQIPNADGTLQPAVEYIKK